MNNYKANFYLKKRKNKYLYLISVNKFKTNIHSKFFKVNIIIKNFNPLEYSETRIKILKKQIRIKK
jgi:hypothetical protein